MGINRRRFVKMAGLTTLGLVTAPPVKLFGTEIDEARPGTATEELSTATSSPLSRAVHPPEGATRWAMVVDLRICRAHPECNTCIEACHTIHNVPTYPDKKDEVKWIWKENFEHAFPETEHPYIEDSVRHSNALLFCNHCDNPPCVRVCPTKATWKREEDGIVMMDWHRCIGCRYCIAACPYGSRSFNYRDPRKFFEEQGKIPSPDFPTRTRGVVEKCTFCDERLARGQWPACVEVCPYNALTFGDLDNPKDPVRELLEQDFAIRRKPALGTQPEVFYIV